MHLKSEPNIVQIFSTLSEAEKLAIIRNGSAFYLATLKKRRFLARAKIREFEEKYQTSLNELDLEGLPDDADFQIHEDYILWHHWVDQKQTLDKKITQITPIIERGLALTEVEVAGD